MVRQRRFAAQSWSPPRGGCHANSVTGGVFWRFTTTPPSKIKDFGHLPYRGGSRFALQSAHATPILHFAFCILHFVRQHDKSHFVAEIFKNPPRKMRTNVL